MSDLIERQAAINALGERPMVWTGNDYELGARNQYDADVLALETVPSAQPEIIRCRECKHYTFADNRAFGFPAKRCEWTGFEDVDDDDFCSRAERREDDK